jgi:hypothetical protein
MVPAQPGTLPPPPAFGVPMSKAKPDAQPVKRAGFSPSPMFHRSKAEPKDAKFPLTTISVSGVTGKATADPVEDRDDETPTTSEPPAKSATTPAAAKSATPPAKTATPARKGLFDGIFGSSK